MKAYKGFNLSKHTKTMLAQMEGERRAYFKDAYISAELSEEDARKAPIKKDKENTNVPA